MSWWAEIGAWALPGMRLKRWICLALLGIALTNAGVALGIYESFRPGSGAGRWALVCFLLGLLGAAAGLNRVIHEIVTTLKPNARLVEALYDRRSRRRGPKIVAIGGGTGLSTLLRGLKRHTDNLTAIVTVADDGGSSGRLRQELGVLPPGDLRNCLTALAQEEHLLTELFEFRFPGTEGLGGHSFGNLFLTAMTGVTGDLMKAIQHSSRVLAVKGQVLPATMTQMTLFARFVDGALGCGESAITAKRAAITELWCEPSAPAALPEAIRAIEEADAIIIGPGSLYTSLVPHLLIPDLREALSRALAPRLYVCNVMTQPGEPDHFSASDHLQVLLRYGGPGICDHMLVNEASPWRLLEQYRAKGQHPVELDLEAIEALGVQPVCASLIDEQEGVRHHPELLANAIHTWLETSAIKAHRRTGATTAR